MKQLSEKVTMGGLTGQGFRNLLGRPQLAPLPLLLREAVQNSWDARQRRSVRSIRFVVRVRDLKPEQDAAFRKMFDQRDSTEPAASNQLAKELNRGTPIRVLELADFGTVGLTGPTRPDLPSGDVDSRFVNFFFDFGRSHETSGDGGTYGFGRSSLYTASCASMIVADSVVKGDDGPEHRVMACRIGRSFEVRSGWDRGRYSGRHFWGRIASSIIQPLTGKHADQAVERLGMPPRPASTHTGTTILIPWPIEAFDDGELIASTLLHHLWPKMVSAEGRPAIVFEVRVDGKKFQVPDPASTEEYRAFVKALELSRTRREGPGSFVITTKKPIYTTGCLGLHQVVTSAQTPSAPPQLSSQDEDDLEDVVNDAPEGALNQIALMRPSELVVRYLPVTGTENIGRSWAGVFVCDDSDFVRTAFARAEPPAHDDWVADRLEHRHEKYIVRNTVKTLLPDAVRRALGVAVIPPGPDEHQGPSLGAASARFSRMFLTGDGQGPAVGVVPEPKGGGGGLPRLRISTPSPAGLEMREGVRIAKFRAMLRGRAGTVAAVHAIAGVHIEGGGRLDARRIRNAICRSSDRSRS
jgi:hypothetical protein